MDQKLEDVNKALREHNLEGINQGYVNLIETVGEEQVAESTGKTVHSLKRSFQPKSEAKLTTLLTVTEALGYEIQLVKQGSENYEIEPYLEVNAPVPTDVISMSDIGKNENLGETKSYSNLGFYISAALIIINVVFLISIFFSRVNLQ